MAGSCGRPGLDPGPRLLAQSTDRYRFVEALPKNNYGKVLKTELRRLFQEGS
jgi:acyl-coenzyme A synthetase/AMP-(fatty) acid ligase